MDTKLCECGCGTEIPAINRFGEPRKFAQYHHVRVAEIKDKISKTLKMRWENLSVEEQEAIKEQGRNGLKKVDQKRRIRAVRKAKTGVPRSKKTRQKISRSHIGIRPNKQTRQKQSQSRKKYFKENPEAIDHLRNLRLSQDVIQRDTSIEIKLQDELQRRGVGFNTHVPLLGICEPDVFIEKYNLVIQADGDYWHSLPEVKARDERQDMALIQAGYTVIRFTESSINSDITLCGQIIIETIRRLK